MRGGIRIGAGRPSGARNRKTVETQAAIEQSGLTPLQFMINVMRDEKNDARVRLDAANHAAPYVHARLSSTDLTVNKKEPVDEEALIVKIRMLLADDPKLASKILPGYVPDDSGDEIETASSAPACPDVKTEH